LFTLHFDSSQDPFAALTTALDPSVIRPIDVAAVNGKFFVNIAVAGSIAEVSPEELASKWKRLLGPVAIGFHGA
jgi:diacylglycerol kinase family enzyme